MIKRIIFLLLILSSCRTYIVAEKFEDNYMLERCKEKDSLYPKYIIFTDSINCYEIGKKFYLKD